MNKNKRLLIFSGLAALIIAAMLAIQPWRASAALPAQGQTLSGIPDSLSNVPLRDNWWVNIPNINPDTKLSYSLEAAWQSNAASEQGFMVYLKAQANTSNAVSDWNAKGEYVLRQLETVANATQPDLMAAVAQQRAESNISRVTQFTIINAIFVRGNAEAARELARRHDVAFIEPETHYELHKGEASTTLDAAVAQAQSNPNTIEPGVNYVKAPQVWALGYRGAGIIVGGIDTGVDYLHPALNRQYRGNLGGGNYDHNYNWFDARQDAPRQNVPYDDDGHGSHTIGTVLGEDASQVNQIGVAPEAKWIAAKVFPNGGSSGNEEITLAEDFMLAPWDLNKQNRRPDLRPHVINNSWGDGECWNTDSWLITQAWIDAGIIPAFSNGNSGPAPGSVGSPAAYPHLIGVGAISATTGNLAGFSSRGPACYNGQIKPDVVAPGVGVRSALPGNTYGVLSGTSMAAPHTAGVMALILDANPSLTYTEVTSILTRTTFFNPSWGVRPNNNYGWGAVQADTSVDMALHGAHVHGAVTSSVGGAPIAGANVSALRTSDNDLYHVTTFPNGTYSVTVRAGTYDMTASAFGYMTQTITGLTVLSDTSPVQNFSLAPLTTHSVSGTFYQTGACVTISGTLRIEPPSWLTVTTGIGGYYSVNLPAGTYTFTAEAGAYNQPIVEVVTIAGPTVRDYTFGARRDLANTYHVQNPGTVAPISGTTQLTFDDPHDGTAAVTLPFPFTFYTGTYSTMNVSTNGYITFNDPNYARMWANTYIPQPGPTADNVNYLYPNNAIYAYWDDLAIAPRSYGAVYSVVTGTAPNRVMVIEWRGVSGTDTPITFSVHLEEATNRITVLYSQIGGPYGYGYSSTQGIENAGGTDGIQVGFNHRGIVGDGMAISYVPAAAPGVTPCVSTPTPTVPPTNTPIIPTNTAVATPTNTPVTCNIEFTDVPPGATFYAEIRCLACRNIIDGYACGGVNPETGGAEPCNAQNWAYFRPNNRVIRGQIAKIVSNSANDSDPPGPQIYADVPTTNTFYAFINRLTNRGVMGGYPCGGINPQTGALEPCVGPTNMPYFRPFNYATRGQIAQITARGANVNDPVPSGTQTFTDVPINSTFYLPVERLRARGVMSGVPCGGVNPQTGAPEPCDADNRPYFRVNNNATRGQTSQIVSRTFFPGCQVP